MTTITSNMTLDEKLLDAARMGDELTIQSVLAAKPAANPKARDPLGNTALMLAAANGHPQCVKILLKPCGARWVNGEGKDALMVAAQAGHADCVAALIGDGMAMRVSSRRFGASTALTLAAAHGHSDVVELLIPASNLDHQNKEKRTALILASMGGHLDCVKQLDLVTDRSKTDEFGHTAFLAAISKNRPECVRYLMQYEDLNSDARHGWTALMYAIWSGSDACLPVLRPYSDIGILSTGGDNALMLAASMGIRRPGVLELLMPGSGPEDFVAYRCKEAEKLARRSKHLDVADRIRGFATAAQEKLELQKTCNASDQELAVPDRRQRRL